jgi:hypothetical protein
MSFEATLVSKIVIRCPWARKPDSYRAWRSTHVLDVFLVCTDSNLDAAKAAIARIERNDGHRAPPGRTLIPLMREVS